MSSGGSDRYSVGIRLTSLVDGRGRQARCGYQNCPSSGMSYAAAVLVAKGTRIHIYNNNIDGHIYT